MPCRWSRRCNAAAAAADNNDTLPSPSSTPNVESWQQIRRQNLRMMRKQVRSIVLLMALIEAIRVGPVQIVYAGRQGYPAPGPEDYGIAYSVGYFVSWLYVCLFMIIFVPLFSWWVPATSSDSENPGRAETFVVILQKINMVLLPASIGISLATYAYYTIQTLIYVDRRTIGSRKLPKNTRENWMVRLFLLLGILISTSFGYGAFQILADMDLAHVKTLEYAIIVVPVQINLGILFGTLVQFKMEKRMIKKQMAKGPQSVSADVKVDTETAAIDEKAALLDV
ncbi:hypothetical protein A1O1_05148 [Capronia coronata CBS 617.96]|uniref:Uncharacterized protein n=1 Tax=Capronia coronata CBS 617.96 TaxID=1182541 RepID=W9Y6Q5_9EURO|nr:uncharacterized protein A1O1_05148 [Capronia coronata CBS 617.96]EXJ88218.1 hypothetical protein A1O1_05148 [Capronia coronata CBS 617.96]